MTRRQRVGQSHPQSGNKVHKVSRAIEQWEERVRSFQSKAREIISDDVRSGILKCALNTSRHTSSPTSLVCQMTPLFVLNSKRSLKPDSREQIPTRWTLAVSMGRKGVCRTCGQRGHWAAECPKRGKTSQGGQGDDGKGKGKQGKSSKGKTDDGKGKGKGGKWQTRNVFGWVLQSLLELVSHEKGWFHVGKKPRAKGGTGKSAAALMNPRQVVQKILQEGGFGLRSFGNQCDDWKWNNCCKVTFHPGPKSLGDDYPMQIEEPRSYNIATKEPVQDVGYRVLPIVTEEGSRRSMNVGVAPVDKALVSGSKVCHKGYRIIILDSEPGQSGMHHTHMGESDRFAREEQRCLHCRRLDVSCNDSWQKVKVLSLTAV